MNVKTTLILVVLALIVAGVFWWTQRDADDNGDMPVRVVTPEGDALFGANEVSNETVTRIEIERDGKRMVLTRDGQSWSQIEPSRFALMSYGPSGLADAIGELASRDKFTPGKDGR